MDVILKNLWGLDILSFLKQKLEGLKFNFPQPEKLNFAFVALPQKPKF